MVGFCAISFAFIHESKAEQSGLIIATFARTIFFYFQIFQSTDNSLKVSSGDSARLRGDSSREDSNSKSSASSKWRDLCEIVKTNEIQTAAVIVRRNGQVESERLSQK